jgi:hypothetical protein
VDENGIEHNIGRSAALNPLKTYFVYFQDLLNFWFKGCQVFPAGCKVENQ